MDIEIFRELEEICKEEWKDLAVTGKNHKSIMVSKFFNHCPACDISLEAKKVNSKKYRLYGMSLHCALCPIDIWREQAYKAKRQHKFIPRCVCACTGNFFARWYEGNQIDRMFAAAAISELSWSYLPEYDKIDNEVYKRKIIRLYF